MVAELLRSADAHEADQLAEIGKNYDTLDVSLPRTVDPEARKSLFIALAFLDGWVDARNHDWSHYKHILSGDWPRLARLLAADLQADRPVRDPDILYHFDQRSH